MQSWLEIDEFSKLVYLDIDTIKSMVEKGKLSSKEENGKIYIEASKSASAIIPRATKAIVENDNGTKLVGAELVDKTINTIMSLHDKVIDAKNETLESLKNENKFLKEALYSMQELYDEDRGTIESLNKQLQQTQEELEFTRRKYKLMWDKTVEGFANKDRK